MYCVASDTNNFGFWFSIIENWAVSGNVIHILCKKIGKTITRGFFFLALRFYLYLHIKAYHVVKSALRYFSPFSLSVKIRIRPRFFDQVGHPLMHLVEISTFSLNNVIGRLAKFMNRADKNWAHF